jgi:hypothetical protein
MCKNTSVFIIAIVTVAMIGVMVPSVFALEVNPKNVDVSSSSVEVIISGNMEDFKSYERLIFTVTSPDKSETEYDVRVTGNGIFSKTFTVSNEWDYGRYDISAKYGNQNLGSTSFMIEPPYDPRIGTSPVNPSPVEESPVEESPVEESPVEESPVEESPVEESPVEESPVEEIKIIEKYPEISVQLELNQESYLKGEPIRMKATLGKIIPNTNIIYDIYEDGRYVFSSGWQDRAYPEENIIHASFQLVDQPSGIYKIFVHYGVSDHSRPVTESFSSNSIAFNYNSELNNKSKFIEDNLLPTELDIGTKFRIDEPYFTKPPFMSSEVMVSQKFDGREYDIIVDIYEFSNKQSAESFAFSISERYMQIYPETRGHSNSLNIQCHTVHSMGWAFEEYGISCPVENYVVHTHSHKRSSSANFEVQIQLFSEIIVEKILGLEGIGNPTSEFTSEQKDVTVSIVKCGPGTELVNGMCELLHTISDSSQLTAEQERQNLIVEAEKFTNQLEQEQREAEQNGGGCLIATATYGSEMAVEVQQLRELRNNQLLQTESGTAFMSTFNDIYYSFSPGIADYERENPYFKKAVKLAITPMISSLSILNYVDMDSESEVLGYGISWIILNLGMYLGVPAVMIVGIRKLDL